MSKTIGSNLKLHRLANNLSQSQLAELCDVSKSNISMIENGINQNIGTCTICDICRVLNITPNDLIPESYYKK